ncbi:MAG: hypothetical protein KatS3mg022_1634 [Armatimonadota bacterium]|nr:MAG: hypothetical protein KatS3mg022_1634 [Armatimonadota bacterium]
MKKEVSPAVAAIIIVAIVAVVALAYWWGTRNEPKLPPAPPSGPIVLPPSQQGRPMPGGAVSGPIQTAPPPGR